MEFSNFTSSYQFPYNHQLGAKLLNEIKPLLNKKTLDQFPKAPTGKSYNQVRVLELHKVIVRIAGTEIERSEQLQRSANMVLARDIIAKNGFKQIKVPKASLVDNYMIEKLLPSIRGGFLPTMAYYVQNHQFFDKAVEEFTKFLIQTTLEDIVGNVCWMQSNWSNHLPRYDNVLIYEKKKKDITKYQIGLIDLEDFKPQLDGDDHVLKAARKAIYLFPYHFDIILATCNKVDSIREGNIKLLECCRERALKSIQESYGVHQNFLLSTSLQAVDPFTQFLNSKESQSELIAQVSEAVLKVHSVTGPIPYLVSSDTANLLNYQPWKNEPFLAIVNLKFLGNNPEHMLNYCEKNIFYPFLSEICQYMKEVIDLTKYDSLTQEFRLISRRKMVWVETPSKEIFSCSGLENDPHTFTVTTPKIIDPSLVKPIMSYFSDMIVKSDLHTGGNNLYMRKIMINLFKERGFIAQAFHDEKHTTVFF